MENNCKGDKNNSTGIAYSFLSSWMRPQKQAQLLLKLKREVDVLSENLTAGPQDSKLWQISLWTFI